MRLTDGIGGGYKRKSQRHSGCEHSEAGAGYPESAGHRKDRPSQLITKHFRFDDSRRGDIMTFDNPSAATHG